jgi:tRNA pseudouridine32 synthase/23S rRNA pseudouridine746 synthase
MTILFTLPTASFEIIYEDDDLVVNKPAGLLSVMGRLPEHQDSAYLRILDKHPMPK